MRNPRKKLSKGLRLLTFVTLTAGLGIGLTGCASVQPVNRPCGVITDSLFDVHATTIATGAATVATQANQLAPIVSTFEWIKYVLGGAAIASFAAGVVIMLSQNAKAAAEAGTATTAVNLDADAGHPSVPVNDANPPTVTILPLQKVS